MNRNELVDSILKDVDRVEDEDALEDDAQEYRRPQPPKEPSQVYSVRIPVERLEQLRQAAERRRVTPSALLREWVVERLDSKAGAGQTLTLASGGVTATLEADDETALHAYAESLAALVAEVRLAIERQRARPSEVVDDR